MTERDENQYAKNCNDSDHNNEDNDYHIPRWWSDIDANYTDDKIRCAVR